MSEPTQKIVKSGIPTEANKNLAFIIDNEVVVVMATDERHAAVFLSSPTVVEYTRSAENTPQVGYKWDGTNFTPPVSE